MNLRINVLAEFNVEFNSPFSYSKNILDMNVFSIPIHLAQMRRVKHGQKSN